MKKGLHPEYMDCTVKCTCGNTFVTRSTKPELKIDICNACHPFFTGTQKLIDTGGRVQRFADKFGSASAAVAEREAAKKAAKAAAAAELEAKKKAEREAKAAEKAAVPPNMPRRPKPLPPRPLLKRPPLPPRRPSRLPRKRLLPNNIGATQCTTKPVSKEAGFLYRHAYRAALSAASLAAILR